MNLSTTLEQHTAGRRLRLGTVTKSTGTTDPVAFVPGGLYDPLTRNAHRGLLLSISTAS